MKKINLILFTFLSVFSFGQNKAEAILNKIADGIEKLKNIEIRFTHTLEIKNSNIKESEEGYAIIEGNKYVLNYFANTFIFDGKKHYVICPENREIHIDSEENNETLNPKKLLFFYKKGYSFSLGKKEKSIQSIRLTPNVKSNENSEDVSHIILQVDVEHHQIKSIKKIETKGTINYLEINAIKTNQKLNPNTFTPDLEKYRNSDYYINQ